MAATYIFTNQSIILVQGGAEAVSVLKDFSNQVYSEMVHAYNTYNEATTIAEYLQNSINGIDPGLAGVKIIGSAAFSRSLKKAFIPSGFIDDQSKFFTHGPA